MKNVDDILIKFLMVLAVGFIFLTGLGLIVILITKGDYRGARDLFIFLISIPVALVSFWLGYTLANKQIDK